jgi:hypothetical protein
MRTAFPSSLVGRYSHDYYGACVTIGLRGRPPGAVPVRNNLVVPGDPLPNRTGPFPSIRLSSDYCVGVAVGCPSWIAVWQVAQTTNVFLRLLAISWFHAGCGRPGRCRSASLRTWWTSTGPGCLHSSHRLAWSRVISSLRRTVTGAGARSVRIVPFLRRRGMPPNRATSGLRPLRSTLTWKHLRGPYGVVMVAR